MQVSKLQGREKTIYNSFPITMSESEVLRYLKNHRVNWRYISMIKSLTQFTDDILSSWLNVTVKTFRNYKREDVDFKDNMKEQIILLLSLIKHGIEVFEDNETFEDWLVTSNFYFGDQQPISYLNTVSGIRFVQSRLTAIEYGDNV